MWECLPSYFPLRYTDSFMNYISFLWRISYNYVNNFRFFVHRHTDKRRRKSNFLILLVEITTLSSFPVTLLFHLLFSPHQGYEWVGWERSKEEEEGTEGGGDGDPLEITFQFSSVRNFSALHIYTNNFFTKDTQVRFSGAKFLHCALSRCHSLYHFDLQVII